MTGLNILTDVRHRKISKYNCLNHSVDNIEPKTGNTGKKDRTDYTTFYNLKNVEEYLEFFEKNK